MSDNRPGTLTYWQAAHTRAAVEIYSRVLSGTADIHETCWAINETVGQEIAAELAASGRYFVAVLPFWLARLDARRIARGLYRLSREN